MKLDGEFTIPRPPEETYQSLTDLDFVLGQLDDVEVVERQGDLTTIRAVVGVSHIRGTLVGTARWVALDAPRRAELSVEGGGVSSRVEVGIAFDIAPGPDGGSVVSWTADATIAGRLSSIGAGLIQPIAQLNADRLIESLRTQLGGEPTEDDAASTGGGADGVPTVPVVALALAAAGLTGLAVVAWWRRRRSRGGRT